MTLTIVQPSVIPWLGKAVRENLQEARPPLERIVEFIQGRKMETRVNTSGRSCNINSSGKPPSSKRIFQKLKTEKWGHMAIVILALDFLEKSGQIQIFQHAQVIISQWKSTEVINICWFRYTLRRTSRLRLWVSAKALAKFWRLIGFRKSFLLLVGPGSTDFGVGWDTKF